MAHPLRLTSERLFATKQYHPRIQKSRRKNLRDFFVKYVHRLATGCCVARTTWRRRCLARFFELSNRCVGTLARAGPGNTAALRQPSVLSLTCNLLTAIIMRLKCVIMQFGAKKERPVWTDLQLQLIPWVEITARNR